MILGVAGPAGNVGWYNWWYNNDFALTITGDGRLQLWRSNTFMAQSPPGVFTMVGTVYGLAGKVTIHASAGTCDLYVDGVAVPGLSGLTGLNTAGVGSTSWNQFVTDGFYRCDLFIADGTNPTGNDVHDVLHDVRVDYRAPSGNGASAGFMGNDGNTIDNYLLVDEITPDDDTTYVQSLTPAVDSYALQDAPTGMQVIGATSLVTARKTDAGVAALAQGLRVAGANYTGPSYALPVSYVTHSRQHGVNPSSNAVWTEAAFNAAELVVEKV